MPFELGAILIIVPATMMVGGLSVIQARLAKLFPNPESHPGVDRGGGLETFAFMWTGEHRRIRDPVLTKAVMVSRMMAGLFALALGLTVLASGLWGLA